MALMAPSWPKRFWNAIKPPPPVRRAGQKPAARGRNRIIVLVVVLIILAAVAGALTYSYIRSAAERAEAKYQEGLRLMSPVSYADAIARFDLALAIRPTLPLAYLERGLAKRYLNRLDEALTDLTRALDLDPGLNRAYSGRAYIYRERGDFPRAIAEFTRSIQSLPNVEAYYERGQCYATLGENRNALADFDQAIELMRDAPHVYRARSFLKKKLGDYAGAEADSASAARIEHH